VTGDALEFALASGMDAPCVARGLLTDWFAPVLSDGGLTAARLMVSELVANAVCHGRGRITLRARVFEDRVLVEVIDEGDGFEHEPRERDFEGRRVRGWGLAIVDAESTRWGVRRDHSHVWFELARPGRG
jgi:anti-sigma regulatory factor (Ser/Thr protein kinase)